MKRSMARVLMVAACLFALPGCGGDDLRTVVFRGSGSDGGNARVVSLGFALRSHESGVRLEWLDLLADSVSLPIAPECRDDQSVRLDPPAAPLTVRLTSSRLTRFELQVPAAGNGCWLRVNTPTTGALLRMRGRLPDGGALFVETELDGGLALLPREERLAWGVGAINEWLLVLDLESVLDPTLFAGLTAGDDGVIRVDAEHNPSLKEEFDRRVRERLFLLGDLDGNLRLSADEWVDENVLATGVSGAIIHDTAADGDADQIDREEPPCPAVIFTPAEMRFDQTEPGSSALREATIRNFGCSDLLINDLRIGGATPADFIIESPTSLPVVVEPGSQLSIGIKFMPTGQSCVRGTLEVVSNDPVWPVVTIDLVVDGCTYEDGDHDQEDGDTSLAPTAAFDVECPGCDDPAHPEPLDKITLDASSSSASPGAGLLSYWWEWEEKPARSEDAVLTCSSCNYQSPVDIARQWTDEPTAKLFLAASGRYVIRLKVRDSRGLESTENPDLDLQWARVAFDVKPSSKVHVQLVWDQGFNTDLDLHLTRYREQSTFGVPSSLYDHPSGVLEECMTDADCSDQELALNCSPTKPATQTAPAKICTFHTVQEQNDDCFFRNRQPDWGFTGESGDDPRLDIDDVDGHGPENISLHGPVDGVYRVTARWASGPQCTGCTADVCDCRTTGTCTQEGLDKCLWCEGCAQVMAQPVNAFVTIHLNGEKVGEYHQHLDATNQNWKVADISWTGGAEGAGSVQVIPAENGCIESPCASDANPFHWAYDSMDPANADHPASIWCDGEEDPDCPS